MNTMKIQGISLSEFNDKTGFQLIMTVQQQNILTQQQFNLCSDLILPRQELCQRIIAIQYKKDYFLLGMPSLSVNKSDDKKYARQKYIYSVNILIKKEEYLSLLAKQNLYKQIIRKLAYYFKFLQQSYHLIYDHKKAEDYIRKLLTKILKDVNIEKRCFLNHLCCHYTFINLNYSPFRQFTSSINQSEVPITNLSIQQIEAIQSDLGKQLLKYAYDGQYTMKKIYSLHKQRQIQIKQFYKKAIDKGLVFIVDMFSLNNIYVATDQIHTYNIMESNHYLLSEIKQAVILQKYRKSSNIDQTFILLFFGEFNRVMPLSRIIAQHKSILQKVNLVKLIRIGLILGIIKRVHHHMIYFQACPLISMTELKRFYGQKNQFLSFSNTMNFYTVNNTYASSNMSPIVASNPNSPINTTSSIQQKNNFIEEQYSRLNNLLYQHLVNNDNLDQICASMEIDYDSLMKIISPQKRYVLAVSD